MLLMRQSVRFFNNLQQCHVRKISIARTFKNKEQSEPKYTHFGFETVDENEKTKKVYEVFETVASNYDLMNDAMSFGIHRIWKDIFVERLGPCHGIKLLDVAGGTGDIAFRVLRYLESLEKIPDAEPSHITILDINQAMLDVGKNRAARLGLLENTNIDWKCGNAEELVDIESDSYNAYTIAFGIRNVTRIDKALAEAYRVLEPGGRFMCLEFSHVENEILQKIYDQYSFQIIPVLGQLIAGQWKPYKYLVESIRKFPNQEDFKNMIQQAGFRNVSYENLTGGIVAIHSGFKL